MNSSYSSGALKRTDTLQTSFKKAVILLSGGLDSATTLAIAKSAGYTCYALSCSYGQRNKHELNSAKLVAESIKVERHIVLNSDLSIFGGSALTSDIEVPKGRTEEELSHGVPVTYVPARNTVFLSLALAWSEVLEATDIFIGVNALDYSGYPDCRPNYIKAFEDMANLATRLAAEDERKIRIRAPLIDLSKSQIIQRGLELGVDYGITNTCYDPKDDGCPCGGCDACHLREKGFAEAGRVDPLLLRLNSDVS